MLGVDSAGLPTGGAWKFFYSVLVSLLLLIVVLVGAKLFANTSLATFCLVCFCYFTFLLSLFIRHTSEVPIPKTNAHFYLVPNNASDPSAGMHPDTYNRTLYLNFTGFRYVFDVILLTMISFSSMSTLSGNLLDDYTNDYTTDKETNFALIFAIIFSGVTGMSITM